MPEVMCSIHNEAMQEKQGKYGSFWSHRTDDQAFPNGWCNGRHKGGPYQAPVTHQTPPQTQNPAPTATKPSEPDWDSIAVGKVASNIVNALVAKGTPLAEITTRLDEIFELAQKICRYKPDLPF